MTQWEDEMGEVLYGVNQVLNKNLGRGVGRLNKTLTLVNPFTPELKKCILPTF